MEDSSEDLPKPPRRTAARPFFSPRPEGVTGPLELGRRRSAQLFTPPGSSPGTPSTPAVDRPIPTERAGEEAPPPTPADATVSSATESSASYDAPTPDVEDDWTMPPARVTEETLDAESPLAERNAVVDGDELIVEQFEHKEIELTSSSATTEPDEHSIEVIAYDDANSLLRAAANEGERPQVDGLRIETTEFSFQEPDGEPLQVESFWAMEPFGAKAAQSASAPGARATPEEREVEHAEMSLDEAETSSQLESHPLEWGNVDTMRTDALQRPADSTPPWVGRPTPTSTESLEELKESEPWTMSPPSPEPPAAEPSYHGESTHQPTMEDRFTQERAAAAPLSNPVADALDRIAARVRDGELDVSPAFASNDAAALAAVLTALLRQPH